MHAHTPTCTHSFTHRYTRMRARACAHALQLEQHLWNAAQDSFMKVVNMKAWNPDLLDIKVRLEPSIEVSCRLWCASCVWHSLAKVLPLCLTDPLLTSEQTLTHRTWLCKCRRITTGNLCALDKQLGLLGAMQAEGQACSTPCPPGRVQSMEAHQSKAPALIFFFFLCTTNLVYNKSWNSKSTHSF